MTDRDLALTILVMLAKRCRDARRRVRAYRGTRRPERQFEIEVALDSAANEAHNAYQSALKVYNEAIDDWIRGIASPTPPPE